MKAFKVIGILLLLIVGLLAAGGYYLYSNLNSLVKEGVETVGPQVTGTNVKLNSVDIALKDARAQFKGFSVANPAGFTTDNAFSFEDIVFDIDPSSLQTDVIVIDEMRISGVSITAEQKGLDPNLQALLRQINENVGGGSTQQEQAAEESAGKEIKLAIKKLVFSDNKVNLVTEKYGDYVLEMPIIESVNLGSASNGLTPAQMGKAIVDPLIKQAKKTAEKRLKKLAEENIKDKAEAKMQEKLDSALDDDAKEKLDKVKGLFGK